jgi:hypothetical protein
MTTRYYNFLNTNVQGWRAYTYCRELLLNGMEDYHKTYGYGGGFVGTAYANTPPPKIYPQRVRKVNRLLEESGFDPIELTEQGNMIIPTSVSSKLPVFHAALGGICADSGDSTLRLKLVMKTITKVSNFYKIQKCWSGMETFMWKVQPELWVQTCVDLLDRAAYPGDILNGLGIYFNTVFLHKLGISTIATTNI